MLLLIILLYLVWNYKLFRRYEFFLNYYNSNPTTIVKYNVKQIVYLSKLEQHPLCFDVYGAFNYIPMEKYFPLKRVHSLGSIETLLRIDNNSCGIGMVQEDIVGNIDMIKSIDFSKVYNKNISNNLKLDNIQLVCSIFPEKYTLISTQKHSSKKVHTLLPGQRRYLSLSKYGFKSLRDMINVLTFLMNCNFFCNFV